MAIYDQYTSRDRFKVGVKIKIHQARKIYALGIKSLEGTPKPCFGNWSR